MGFGDVGTVRVGDGASVRTGAGERTGDGDAVKVGELAVPHATIAMAVRKVERERAKVKFVAFEYWYEFRRAIRYQCDRVRRHDS